MTVPLELRAILGEACAAAGLSAAEAEPIRLGENAIFRLSGGIVARIARPGQQAAARREVAISQWLNASGVRAVAAVQGIEQPVAVNGRSVTFWEELPAHRQGDPGQVAAVLKRLHSLPVPANLPLGNLNPFVRLEERMDQAVTVSAEDRAWLRARLDELAAQWQVLGSTLTTCAIHGDAWAGNVVATEDGQVILLDLERFSVGPPEWDLVSTAVKLVTYGQLDRAAYTAFCEVYGTDVTAQDEFAVLRDIRELRMTCYIAQQAAGEPKLVREANFRIACLRGKHGERPWAWTAAT